MKSSHGKSRFISLVVVLVAALCTLLWAGSHPVHAKDKPIILRVASPFPAPPADVSRFFMKWVDRVKERSGGRVDFKYFWGGSLVTAPESLSMLSNRSFDIGIVCWLYQPGITPLGTVDWAVPFNTEDCTRSTLAKKKLFEEVPEVMQELTRHKVKPFLWHAMGPYWLYTKFPINTLDDLKGKKIGCSGRDIPVYVKATGAIPVTNVVAEKYEMLQRGVTEGECMSFFYMTDYKVYEVVKHLYDVNVSRSVTSVYCIHDDAWNSLPQDIQKIMLEEAPEAEKWQCSMEPGWTQEHLKKWRDAKVTIGTLPDKEIVKWADLIKEHPQNWANECEKKGLPGKKVMKHYIKLLERLGEKMPVKYVIQ
jgi:TRAP-type C4-dicarboxylate transport system substrate-binding protein